MRILDYEFLIEIMKKDRMVINILVYICTDMCVHACIGVCVKMDRDI